jgi:hypothetical protein
MAEERNFVDPLAAERNPNSATDPEGHKQRAGKNAAGVGASGAGIVGAGAGMALGGPVGAVIGAAAGAVIGGLAGKKVAESIADDDYWRQNYMTRPYVRTDLTYDDYQPAYRHGWESRARFQGEQWDRVEDQLARDWDRTRGSSRLGWEEARPATRDAWDRWNNQDETPTDR